MSIQTNAAALWCCRPFRVMENNPANVFLDLYSCWRCQNRLFSMFVIISPQPRQNIAFSRFLLLFFFLMHNLLQCKLLACICFVISVQLHALNCSFQVASNDPRYKCHGAVPLICFGYVHMFLNSYRLLIVQKTLCTYRSTHWKSCRRLLCMLDFACSVFLWPSKILLTMVILGN